jgi:hypothetical protein
MVELLREFFKRWVAESIFNSAVTNDVITTVKDILKQVIIKFWFAILFGQNSIYKIS